MTAPAATLTRPATDRSWQAHAACLGDDQTPYFAHDSQPDLQARAIDTCSRCPVRQPCAAWAIERPSEQGVWGGLTEEQRATIRRRTNRSEP